MSTNAQSALRAAVQYVADLDTREVSGVLRENAVIYIAEKFQTWLNEQEGRGSGTNRTERTDRED